MVPAMSFVVSAAHCVVQIKLSGRWLKMKLTRPVAMYDKAILLLLSLLCSAGAGRFIHTVIALPRSVH